jgi:hypothetical protein
MSNKSAQKDLLAVLREMKLTEYGEFIPASLVQEILEIEMPATASRSEFAKLEIVEMAAIDYCRGHLINEGKYIKQVPNGYRVLLPSENLGQIESYMSSADRKLSRALKLSRNTPRESAQIPDQTEARILMKMSGKRRDS